jgi:C1A family cysteine protease
VISDLRLRESKYGWIPDLPDQRDFSYTLIQPTIETLPETVDLRSQCSLIESQGSLGSCTACALVGNLELLKKKELNKVLNFSRLFLYYNERLIRKTTDTDSGASLRDGIKTLVKAGDCPEDLWPYEIEKFTLKPSEQAYQSADDYQITSYYRINSTSEMKHTLSTGFPFVFGFAVYESFESPEVAQSGIVPMPQATERMIGGHAVMAVGYEDKKEQFIVRNSWGEGWGDKGYFYMPYAYLSSSFLSSDFWTIRDME